MNASTSSLDTPVSAMIMSSGNWRDFFFGECPRGLVGLWHVVSGCEGGRCGARILKPPNKLIGASSGDECIEESAGEVLHVMGE